MAVTVTQLVAFLSVARHGSLTAAAKELVVTQPSVSAAINALQRELGVRLIDRNGRSVRLTSAGEAYAPYAADIIGLLEQGARSARESGTGTRRTLRIGAVMTAGEHLVAPLLRTFREAYADLEITLHVGNRKEVFQRLIDHEVDVAITGSFPQELPLEGRPFAANQFALVTWPGDALAKRRTVALSELAGRAWLLREPGSGTRILSEDYLAVHELHPNTLTLGSNGAIKQAVALGLGIALLPRCAVALELELGRLEMIHPRGGVPQRAWHVVRSSIGPVRSEAAAFMEFAASRAAAHALARTAAPVP